MATLRELLQEGSAALVASSPTPRLDAELLLGAVTGHARAYMVGFGERVVPPDQQATFRAMIARRQQHEPVGYLVGRKEFFGLDFTVNPAVLIPRPDTEVLVERAIEFIETQRSAARILDLGTGSGCIPIALASFALKLGRRVEVVAVDSSPAALAVAQHNAEQHGLSDSVRFLLSNWFDALDPAAGSFDLIVTNPPYIPEGSTERSPETNFEPAAALFAGADGLDDIRAILREVPQHLASNGLFLCEIGAHQGQAVLDLWAALHPALPCHVEILRDLSGLERCVVIARQ
ncbi:MAG: peptide chain release factor N(5)-glutamine methyltransferase [Proteobacteria bacterium]|nr:peptide chain release factor N(5)-glutamine methyltransferase [Pseudomonadota bacterium]